MEKVIRRDTLNEVFEVIDKHMAKHEQIILDLNLKKWLGEMFDDVELASSCDRDIRDSASAIACLEMLKLELRGIKEY